jgi:cytochrome c biogenesis protein CcmG, thiol:disulfide interchange protein DsbE
MRPFAVAFIVVFALVSTLVKRELLHLDTTHAKLPVGRDAPALVLPAVGGAGVDLQEVTQRNKVVLVMFWATWCTPCRIELPEIEKLYARKRAAGLEILAVNEDREPDKLAAYLKERPLSFPVLVDEDGKVAAAYGVEGFPTTVVIDRQGHVVRVESGFATDLEFLVDWQLKQGGQGATDG